MKTKFLHIRNQSKEGTTLSHGGLTIAYLLDDKYNVIGFAPARCHINDNYNKKVGRIKSEGRLKSDKFFVQVHEEPENTFLSRCQEMFKFISDDNRRVIS